MAGSCHWRRDALADGGTRGRGRVSEKNSAPGVSASRRARSVEGSVSALTESGVPAEARPASSLRDIGRRTGSSPEDSGSSTSIAGAAPGRRKWAPLARPQALYTPDRDRDKDTDTHTGTDSPTNLASTPSRGRC